MLHIVVAFSQEDLNILSDQLGKKCILLSDVTCSQDVGKHIQPKLDKNSEIELSSKVKELFTLFEKNIEANSISGFANNFYECSIAPVSAYINTLSALIIELKQTQNYVEVWFATKFIYKKKYSAYFMAEHESQGKRLYSRDAVFRPYLEEICKNNGVNLKYRRVRVGMQSIPQRMLRVVAVLGWRFMAEMREIWGIRKSPISEYTPIDLMVITRSLSQTEFIMPFLMRTNLNISVLAGEASLGRGRNKVFVKNIASKYSKISGSMVRLSAISLIFNNVRALWLMVIKPPARIKFNNVVLNLDQAMTEVIAMWPALATYRDALYREVKEAGIPTTRIMLSTEQKSPHAYVDAWVAAKCGLICVHVMQCDQEARPLPNPVCGDYFLADSEINATAFANVWGHDALKVRYIGSFKSFPAGESRSYLNKNTKERWCFFSSVGDINTNQIVLLALRKVREKKSMDIFIKLHPRDDITNYKKFPDFKFFTEGEVEKEKLFDSFSHAISFTSGVILDLIFRNKPFILLCFGKWYTGGQSYIDMEYSGNIFNPSQINEETLQENWLMENYQKYRSSFFKKNNLTEDSDIMLAALKKLGITPPPVCLP